MEPDARAARARNRNEAFGRRGGLEAYRQNVEHLAFVGQVDLRQLRAEDVLETKSGSPARVSGRSSPLAERIRPVEPVCNRGEPPFFLQIGHLAHIDDGILQVRGYDVEIFGIEGDQLQGGTIVGGHVAQC